VRPPELARERLRELVQEQLQELAQARLPGRELERAQRLPELEHLAPLPVLLAERFLLPIFLRIFGSLPIRPD
jgi:hypothetical protein